MSMSTADPVFSFPNSVDRRKGYCLGCGVLGGRDGTPLRKCVQCFIFKCKLAQYCSRECQKKDWSLHKPVCGELAGGVLKVANYLIRNDSTRLWVEVALALLFELDKDWTPKEWQEFVEQPSFAYVEFCMEPSDIHTMQRLLADPGGFTHTNVEGMLQVLHLVKPDQCDPPQTPNAGQMAYWTTGREDAIRKGMPNVPVISVVIGNRLIEGLTATMAVYPKTVNIARKKEPFYSFSPLNGRMTKYEFNLKNIFMLINMHIRADKENSMRLRQPLRECDGLLLKDAVQNLPGHAEDTIRRKLAYEEIYQPNARYDLSIPYPLILVKKDTEPQHYSSVIPDPLAIQRRIPNPATTSDQEQC